MVGKLEIVFQPESIRKQFVYSDADLPYGHNAETDDIRKARTQTQREASATHIRMIRNLHLFQNFQYYLH